MDTILNTTYYTKKEIIDMISDNSSYQGVTEANLKFERLGMTSIFSGVDVWSAGTNRIAVFRKLDFISDQQGNGSVTVDLGAGGVYEFYSRAVALSDHSPLPQLEGVICDIITTGAGSAGWRGVFEIWKIV